VSAQQTPERCQYADAHTANRCTICTVSKRVSLILGDSDQAVIAPYLSQGSPAFEVLRQWANQHDVAEDIKSEAAALRALLQAGAEALQELVLDAGYAQLASEFNSESANVERRTARDRYTRRTEGRK
jgi:hypothetical protein